jgi:hypothetical protein
LTSRSTSGIGGHGLWTLHEVGRPYQAVPPRRKADGVFVPSAAHKNAWKTVYGILTPPDTILVAMNGIRSTDFMRRDASQPPPRQEQPGEPLFVMRRGNQILVCELRNHREFGIQAQFRIDANLLMGRRFENRALAIAWAEQRRQIQAAQGWIDDPTAEWPAS